MISNELGKINIKQGYIKIFFKKFFNKFVLVCKVKKTKFLNFKYKKKGFEFLK